MLLRWAIKAVLGLCGRDGLGARWKSLSACGGRAMGGFLAFQQGTGHEQMTQHGQNSHRCQPQGTKSTNYNKAVTFVFKFPQEAMP